MKTLQELSIGHLIIETFALSIAVIAALYLVYSVFYLIIWLNEYNGNPEQSELHSRARYNATEDLMKEINNNQNSIK